jgi:protein-tyrosine phosphatase
MAEPGANAFRLIVICTANRFRSPLAEAFLREGADDLPLEVTSLGLTVREARPPIEGAITEAAALGVDISEHRSRPLRAAKLAETDLVLGFESIHVAQAVVEAGAPRERAFTILEFVRLGARLQPPLILDPVERARRMVTAAHTQRFTAPAVDPALEFPDPLAGPESAYPTVVARIQELSDQVLDVLFGPAV